MVAIIAVLRTQVNLALDAENILEDVMVAVRKTLGTAAVIDGSATEQHTVFHRLAVFGLPTAEIADVVRLVQRDVANLVVLDLKVVHLRNGGGGIAFHLIPVGLAGFEEAERSQRRRNAFEYHRITEILGFRESDGVGAAVAVSSHAKITCWRSPFLLLYC